MGRRLFYPILQFNFRVTHRLCSFSVNTFITTTYRATMRCVVGLIPSIRDIPYAHAVLPVRLLFHLGSSLLRQYSSYSTISRGSNSTSEIIFNVVSNNHHYQHHCASSSSSSSSGIISTITLNIGTVAPAPTNLSLFPAFIPLLTISIAFHPSPPRNLRVSSFLYLFPNLSKQIHSILPCFSCASLMLVS